MVVADAFNKSTRSVPSGSRSTASKIGVLASRYQADSVKATLQIVDRTDEIGPERVFDLLVASGASAEQAKAALRGLAQINAPDEGFVEQVQALGVEHETLTQGLAELAAVIRVGAEHASGLLV